MKVTQRKAKDFAEAVGLRLKKTERGDWYLAKVRAEILCSVELTSEDLLEASLEFEGKS